MRWRNLAAIILLISLSGCIFPLITKPAPALPLPDAPGLPGIESAELGCLSDDTYRRLVERDVKRKVYANQLEAVIRSTH